jgi:uncharacterized membrane protein
VRRRHVDQSGRRRADRSTGAYGDGVRGPGTTTWLSVLLGGSGVVHLVRPRTYEWLVPPELGAARPWVVGTGVAELAAAALMTAPPTRRAGGLLAAVLLVAFVPAHLHTFRVVDRRPLPLAVAAARLPLQVPLVRAAWRVRRGR